MDYITTFWLLKTWQQYEVNNMKFSLYIFFIFKCYVWYTFNVINIRLSYDFVDSKKISRKFQKFFIDEYKNINILYIYIYNAKYHINWYYLGSTAHILIYKSIEFHQFQIWIIFVWDCIARTSLRLDERLISRQCSYNP